MGRLGLGAEYTGRLGPFGGPGPPLSQSVLYLLVVVLLGTRSLSWPTWTVSSGMVIRLASAPADCCRTSATT